MVLAGAAGMAELELFQAEDIGAEPPAQLVGSPTADSPEAAHRHRVVTPGRLSHADASRQGGRRSPAQAPDPLEGANREQVGDPTVVDHRQGLGEIDPAQAKVLSPIRRGVTLLEIGSQEDRAELVSHRVRDRDSGDLPPLAGVQTGLFAQLTLSTDERCFVGRHPALG